MNRDESRPPLRDDGPSPEDMGVKPKDCGTGHPHIDASLLDMCRIIVENIDTDPKLFAKAHEASTKSESAEAMPATPRGPSASR